MGLLPNIGYPQTGDVADAGTYVCMNCTNDENDNDDSTIITLNTKDKLPECPSCGHTYWM